MENITYKKLEYSEINIFSKLREDQLKEEGAKSDIELKDYLIDYYKRHLEDETFVAYLALFEDKIIATGAVSFVERPPHYGNLSGKIAILSSMYTLSEYRRMGIGKKILEVLLNDAKKYGCSEVQISASPMGAKLYECFGFIKCESFFRLNL